jgi:molybdopterin/thiamine biosynthesis adenylyltransferase
VLVVGVGGLGCEYIKMLSLMGFSAENGRIIIVDDDKI